MNDQQLTRQNMERIAHNRASAKVYLLQNSYLSLIEKEEVEMWYQLPGDAGIFAFLVIAIYSTFRPLGWSEMAGIPLLLNGIIGVYNWYFYNKKLVNRLYWTILHPWTLYLVGVGTAIFLFFKGATTLGLISLVAPFGLLAFIEPHIYLYTILAQKHRMHPKYAFFKRYYGRQFPFEKDL